ncbi:Erg28p [Sporobolomyces salmoneus]|uniref:Erg28p n=1 Tax=Sporobolomyces salmoneus TaxID=183962 RepID=UPI0031784F40
MLFVSSLAIFNSVQNFLTTSLTRKVYARSPAYINPLQARTFGIWTLTSAFIRLYASYHISNKPVFDLALISYGIAWFHFVSEFVVFGTAGLKGAISPFIVSTTSLFWMLKQYDFYVSA